MGFAVLKEFKLHLYGRRVEMKEVNVVKAGSRLFLIGRVKAEAVASENGIVLKTRTERVARIKLIPTRKGILAFEDEYLGAVIWDWNTNALKLPRFMLALLNYPDKRNTY